MVGSSQIFVDGILGQDTVGRQVGGGGEGCSLMLEDQASDEL